MDFQTKKRIIRAVIKLYTNDDYLLKNNLNERTIMHKLAAYLQDEFIDEGYNVDCEYNKNVEDKSGLKTIYILQKEARHIRRFQVGKEFEDNIKDEREYLIKPVYPDIVIHKRGSNHKNLLIIEIKKLNNS
ncbi:hypothetical protein ACFO4N_18030 [Camelliibacillus cellulosilyticus]|uniref:Uncharacterized protein n=1 Tax=Camelliibacillus cellulosilyticus TaxID=2174486 RepID=A0ABV9GSS5_9BACL